jgi:hypothetical protein
MRTPPDDNSSENSQVGLNDDDGFPTQHEFAEIVIAWWRRRLSTPRKKTKWSDIAIIILIFLTAVAAFWSAFIFQGQLVAMREAERHWMTVRITANTDYVPGAIIGGPLTFDAEGRGNLTSKITMENIGKSVAVHVYSRTSVVATGLVGRLDFPIQEQRKLCDGPNAYSSGTSTIDSRFTIFPNDTEVEFAKSGFETAPIETRPEDRGLKNGKPMQLFLVGCIDYESPASTESPHQTGFIYQVSGQSPPHGIQSLMSFSVSQLKFEPYTFGGKYAY